MRALVSVTLSPLVLEENDIQLTNCHVVTDAVLKSEEKLGRAADEIYLVTTSFAPWQALRASRRPILL
jgi:hypothetical protein